ncbi:MAG: KTSC domain-containing protein [Bacteroidetes bacterium]|nr:KTSC domain-containing protein [Bacteroidota bacterium]
MTWTLAKALDILGLSGVHAGLDAVKVAYRRLMLRWHPDRFRESDAVREATVRAQEINNAYEIVTEHIELHGDFGRESSEKWEQESSRPRHARHSYGKRGFTPGFPDETVFEVFVKSSHIISAGYNPARRILYIKFDRNLVYEYSAVPKSIWDAFMAAESHGRYAIRNIYHSFRYRRCREANSPYNPGAALQRIARTGGAEDV